MFPIKNLPSPNFDSRKGASVSLLVLHYTDTETAQEALDILCDPKAKVSSHYVVDEDGTIYSLVDEANCAWHAGVSYWGGTRNVNSISVGIEIVNPGVRYKQRPFPKVQMEAVAELCKGIISRHNIKPASVIGHSDVAPARKIDPGEHFDWQWLAGQGVGLWPIPDPKGTLSRDIAAELAIYGYEPPEGQGALKKTVEAFQRHYRQNRIDGVWDAECDQILAGLLKIL